MDFNIEKMVEDGIDEKLIDFCQLSETDVKNKIAINLEAPQFFKQFNTEKFDEIVYLNYAYAAGLITRNDAEVLKTYFSRKVMWQSIITDYGAYSNDGWSYAITNFNEQVYNIEMGDKLKIYIEDDLWYEFTVNEITHDDSETASEIGFYSSPKSRNRITVLKEDKRRITFMTDSETFNPPSAKVGAKITVTKVK